MKIKPEHYETIKDGISKVKFKDLEKRVQEARADSRVKDFNMRMRWDLFHMAQLTKFACDTLYGYCNDDHIDTALRQICRELGLPFHQKGQSA